MSPPLKWEFPGGKIRRGETAEECLHREIREELGVSISVESALQPTTHEYPSVTVTLYPFVCTIADGEIELHEHADMIWLPPEKLAELDWAAADIPVLSAYCRRGGLMNLDAMENRQASLVQDCQGRSAEVPAMRLDHELRTILTAAMPFVAARKKETGGFGATPRLPATIEDTYHALHILQLARQFEALADSDGNPAADGELRSYLAACLRLAGIGLRTTFQLLWCCRAAGLPLDREAVAAGVLAKMPAAGSLEGWYFGVRIFAEVLGEKSRLPAESPELTLILGHKWRAVDEAWMHIYLCRELRDSLPRPAPELIAWFRACQNGDGGFGFFPGTTSYVENCHACLRALAFLGAAPLAPGLAFRFVSGCQNASGGFGRSGRAASFLDSTWHALAALAFIA